MDNARTARIFIRASQSDGRGMIDSMEFFTEGKYYDKDGSRYITYKESAVSGMEGATSTVKISGETVSLIRTGNMNSRFVFANGREIRTVYRTEYGVFNITIDTHRVEIRHTDDGSLALRLQYGLRFDGQDPVVNDMEIKVTLSR